METQRYARLVAVMGDLASGDRAALAALYQEFGGAIAAVLRSELRRQGAFEVSAEDLDGLVIDACLELGRVAHSWRPDGALPWNWARPRLNRIVTGFVGVHAEPFDDDRDDTGEGGGAGGGGEPVQTAADTGDDVEVLAALGRGGHDLAALLAEAFIAVGMSERSQSILIGYQLQEALGDPSPSLTIGAVEGMQSDAVRQSVSRSRRRLRDLAGRDERFAPLADIPLIA